MHILHPNTKYCCINHSKTKQKLYIETVSPNVWNFTMELLLFPKTWTEIWVCRLLSFLALFLRSWGLLHGDQDTMKWKGWSLTYYANWLELTEYGLLFVSPRNLKYFVFFQRRPWTVQRNCILLLINFSSLILIHYPGVIIRRQTKRKKKHRLSVFYRRCLFCVIHW